MESIDQPIPTSRPRRRWWRPLLLVVVAFGSGVLLGGGLTGGFLIGRLSETIHHPERIAPRAAERMQGRLGLTPEQREAVEAILARTTGRLVEIRDEAMPEALQEIHAAREEIDALLSPEQRQALRERWRFLMPLLIPDKFRDDLPIP